MESSLRWIMIIAGIALLAGLFLFGNPNRKPKRRASRSRKRPNRNKTGGNDAQRHEPTLDETPASRFDEDFPGPIPDDAHTLVDSQGELLIDPEPEPTGPAPDKVVVLYLQARDNRYIAGADLLESALKSGMTFGAMDIFHRIVEGNINPVFSLANLTNPGHFDKSTWNTMETKGVSLFMALPGPISALDAWDSMLATARVIAEALHMDLLDDTREVFTRQREGEIRQELRDYERSQLPEE